MHDVEIGVGAGQRSATGGTDAAPALGTEQRRREAVRRRQATVPRRAPEEVGMDRIHGTGPQHLDRTFLAHHLVEQRGGGPTVADAQTTIPDGSPNRWRTISTIRVVSSSTGAVPSTTTQWWRSPAARARNPSRTRWANSGPEPLQAIGRGLGQTGLRHLDRNIDQHREVGNQTGGGPRHHALQLLDLKATPVALIRQRRPRESIAHHPLARGQRRRHDQGDVLGPIGRHQERLGAQRDGRRVRRQQESRKATPRAVAPGS